MIPVAAAVSGFEETDVIEIEQENSKDLWKSMPNRLVKFHIVFTNTKWRIILFHFWWGWRILFVLLYKLNIFFLYTSVHRFPQIISWSLKEYSLVSGISNLVISFWYSLLISGGSHHYTMFSTILRVVESLDHFWDLWHHAVSQFVKILPGSQFLVGWSVLWPSIVMRIKLKEKYL